METNDERRRRKLGELAEKFGLEAVAEGTRKADPKLKTSAASLKQVVQGYASSHELGDGSRSERALGDRVARAIEDAFHLGRGWFDNDEDQMLSPQEFQLIGVFRQLGESARDMVIERMNALLENEKRQAERMRSKLAPPLPGLGGKKPTRQGRS